MDYISDYLKNQILSGNAILFLGAGASLDATSTDKAYSGMLGTGLRDLICDEFLSGKSKNKSLSYVGALSKDLASIIPVHELIKKYTCDLNPTPGHLNIPSLRWKAIVTTNYDELVEKAYSNTKITAQKLHRIVGDDDDLQKYSADNSYVPLLKLHGCISRINDVNLPLILSSHDYHKFKINRTSLFNTLKEWAYSHTIIFCGYSISDENIRDLIFDVSEVKNERPKYILVDPTLEKQDIAYWSSNRFECAPVSFTDFMKTLVNEASSARIALSGLTLHSSSSVIKHIPSHEIPSQPLIEYIEKELLHLTPNLANKSIPASTFFKGISDGFGWVADNYDIPRKLTNTLLEDAIFDSYNLGDEKTIFFLVKGYAGSGKSVCLKRFAWEAGVGLNQPVFFLAQGAQIRKELIIEMLSLIKSRIYLVIDDILDHQVAALDLINECKRNKYPMTIISSGRTNEWNSEGESLEREITASYDLLDLDSNEAQQLLVNLTKYNSLGYLNTLPENERLNYLQSALRNQLLVALHEATEGKTFEEIIIDEYDSITPLQAKLVYQDICSLHRFDIPVRAGLLSRIENVNFNNFFREIMAPLENIISVYYDYKAGDFVYRSRHQNISEIVFDKSLPTSEDKSQQIIKVIRYLNVSYDTDSEAISRMIRGRVLADEFTNKNLVYSIFNAAEDVGIHPSVVNHQRAVFELHHPGGDLRSALSYILKAEDNPGNLNRKTLQHTKSNIYRRLASVSDKPLEKRKLRADALSILNRSLSKTKDSLPYFTKGQVLFEELKDIMDSSTDIDDVSIVIDELIKSIESNFTTGLQLFPSDDKLLSLEAEFSKFLHDSPRAIKALEKSFRKNKDSIFTAVRLARSYFSNGRKDEALQLVKSTLINHQTNKVLHFELARMLSSIDEFKNRDEILLHLKRSFSPGDTHYDARYSYARHEYLYGDMIKAKKEFLDLSKIHYSPSFLNKVRGEILDENSRKVVYSGEIISLHGSFGFVRIIDFSEHIYLHYKSLENENLWPQIHIGSLVKCHVGFSFKGIACTHLSII